MSVPVADTK